jgi:hypothetical protein
MRIYNKSFPCGYVLLHIRPLVSLFMQHCGVG